jgi:hypothetical protein
MIENDDHEKGIAAFRWHFVRLSDIHRHFQIVVDTIHGHLCGYQTYKLQTFPNRRGPQTYSHIHFLIEVESIHGHLFPNRGRKYSWAFVWLFDI